VGAIGQIDMAAKDGSGRFPVPSARWQARKVKREEVENLLAAKEISAMVQVKVKETTREPTATGTWDPGPGADGKAEDDEASFARHDFEKEATAGEALGRPELMARPGGAGGRPGPAAAARAVGPVAPGGIPPESSQGPPQQVY
jgi:hypothetical protein